MAITQVKTIIVTAVAAILVLVALGVIIIYSGAINIAASRPHNPVTKWILMTTMKHFVEQRATKIAVPENFRPGTEGSRT